MNSPKKYKVGNTVYIRRNRIYTNTNSSTETIVKIGRKYAHTHLRTQIDMTTGKTVEPNHSGFAVYESEQHFIAEAEKFRCIINCKERVKLSSISFEQAVRINEILDEQSPN